MKAGHKFLARRGADRRQRRVSDRRGVKETGVYFLTPAELAAKTAADPTFVDNVGFKVGAKVVPGSVRRDQAQPDHRFQGVRRGEDLSGHLPRPRARYLHRRQRHRGRGRGPAGARRRHPRHRRARQVRLALRGRAQSLRLLMTLLGQFALWVAFLVGLWCVGIAFSGRWRDRPELAATRHSLGLRHLRLPRGGLAGPLEGSHQPRLQHRVRGRLHQPQPAAVLHRLGASGPGRKARCSSGRWCCRSSPAWRSC